MIGNRLYLLRKAAGLSQAELGDMLSVSHHTISAYEKEKSDPSDGGGSGGAGHAGAEHDPI